MRGKKVHHIQPGLAAALLLAACAISACSDSDEPPPEGTGGSGDANASGGGTSQPSVGGGEPGAGGAGGNATSESGGGSGDGGGVGNGAGGFTTVTCDNTAPALSVEHLDVTTVSELGAPFDTDTQDLGGPLDWTSQYGKSPEIVAVSSGDELDVLFQDQGSADFAYVVHIAPSNSVAGFAITTSYRVASLGRIMGLARDPDGHYYVATGVDEDSRVDETYPPNKIHRPDIVRIVKFDTNGCVLMESDVDMARGEADAESEIIVNPMVAGTSRLVWGADRLLLVHSHNTEPDPAIDGTRHQKAISTHLNALDGSVTRSSTMWVSHSFDQRALYDGTGFVEIHLGDAYPRTLALGHYNDSSGDGGYAVYHIKGASGANNTFTRLGGIVQSDDPSYGYLALFSTERSVTFDGDGLVQGTRDVALVRISSTFMESQVDDTIIEEGVATSSQTVSSAEATQTNALHWLTELPENTHAERPRITALAGGKYLVLFEQWMVSGNRDTYQGTFALSVDNAGSVLLPPTKLALDRHIGRGDDIVTLAERALYVTGGDGALRLNLVAADLSSESISLP